VYNRSGRGSGRASRSVWALWRRDRSSIIFVNQWESVEVQTSKTSAFHGGDYEECRLLGYKTTVRSSQEKQYVSATELSCLMLCKIWGFDGGDYEICCLHMAPCGTYRFHHQSGKNQRVTIVATNVFPSSPILVILMMEEISSSEKSVLTRATWRHISEDGILKYRIVYNFGLVVQGQIL
jgi:hypothetical protein